MWCRARSITGSRTMRILMKSVEGKATILNRSSKRDRGGEGFHTFGRGRLPELVSLGSKLTGILDIFPH